MQFLTYYALMRRFALSFRVSTSKTEVIGELTSFLHEKVFYIMSKCTMDVFQFCRIYSVTRIRTGCKGSNFAVL